MTCKNRCVSQIIRKPNQITKLSLKRKTKKKIKWGKKRPNMSYGKIFNQNTPIIPTEWLAKAKNSNVINS